MNSSFYRFAKWLVRLYANLAFRLTVTGLEHLPRSGAVIVASNHVTGWDPPLLGIVLPRPIHYMAKEELFRNKLFGAVLRALGAFPVRRCASDISAVKQSLKLLREGKVFGIFVEGTRSQSGELLEAKGGAAMFAVKTRAPVVPCHITAGPKGGRRRIDIRLGPPIEPDDTWKDYDAGAAQIISAIAAIGPESGGSA